jgi:drug/metabolite transporter (DMT)-like permease
MRAAGRVALFGLVCLIWGSTWLVIKVGYGGLGPFTVAALRFAIAAIVLAAIVPVAGARWPRGRGEWTLIVVVSLLLYPGDYALIYWAEQYIDSGLTAILFGTFPLLTMAAAHVYLPGERLTARKVAGGAVAAVGVGALFGDRVHLDAAALVPMGAVIAGAAFAAVSNVLLKRHGAGIHTASMNASSMAIGAVSLLGLAAASGERVGVPRDLVTWGALGYLSLVGSVVAFLIYFSLLKVWTSTTVSFFAVFTPIVAVILGSLVLGERLNLWSVAGAGLILAGVSITLVSPAEVPGKIPAERPVRA